MAGSPAPWCPPSPNAAGWLEAVARRATVFGTDGAEGNISVTANRILHNGPVDVFWDGVGEDVTFAHNVCRDGPAASRISVDRISRPTSRRAPD